MERPASRPSPLGTTLALAGGVGTAVAAVLVHVGWWWLHRTDWGFDYQGTYEGFQAEIADPWFWSVEAACAGAVVVAALVVLVWGLRSRALATVVIVGVAALVALAQMASIRLLLPSADGSTLPSGDSDDFGGSPTREIAVVDDALGRAVLLAIALTVGSILIEQAVTTRRRGVRTQ